MPQRIVVVCERCPHRRGDYSRERAIRDCGDIPIEEWLKHISATCFHRAHPTNLGPWRPTVE